MAKHATNNQQGGGDDSRASDGDWIAREFEVLEARRRAEVETTAVHNRIETESIHEVEKEEHEIGEETIRIVHSDSKRGHDKTLKQLDSLIEEVEKMASRKRSERREAKAGKKPKHYLPTSIKDKRVHHHDVTKYSDIPAPEHKQKVVEELSFSELKPKTEAKGQNNDTDKLRDGILAFMEKAKAQNELHGEKSKHIEDRLVWKSERPATDSGAVSVQEVISRKRAEAHSATQAIAAKPNPIMSWFSHFDIRTRTGAVNWFVAAICASIATLVMIFTRT